MSQRGVGAADGLVLEAAGVVEDDEIDGGAARKGPGP